jgi:hypothetical protein
MLTSNSIPEAWYASELNLAPVSPLIAFCGASPADEFVFELAVQPVSLSAVSVCACAAVVNDGASAAKPHTTAAVMKTDPVRLAARQARFVIASLLPS